jgi:hypothetical protein
MLNEILLLILSLIIVLIPSLKLFCLFYYTFGIFALILILILIVSLLKINLKFKILILACLLLFFKDTLFTIGKTIKNIYKLAYVDSAVNRKDDSKLRETVKNIYSPILILKTNFKRLPNIPTIFVSNYCNDRLENLSCILIPKDIAIIMRDGLKSKLHRLVKWPIYTTEKNNYENIKNGITTHIKENRSIFAYINNAKYPQDNPSIVYSSIRSGLYNIAKELGIPITLVAFDFIDTAFCNIQKQNFHIEIGETFKVENVREAIYKTRKFFNKTLSKFKQQKYIF